MYDLLIEYGMLLLGTILSVLGVGLTRYVFSLAKSNAIGDMLGRLYAEIRAAVAEVGQTYVDALREANLDGKLTEEEKSEAKSKAIAIAKSNFGKKGLLRLARALGIDDKWIGNKVEAFVREAKTPALAAPPKPQA